MPLFLYFVLYYFKAAPVATVCIIRATPPLLRLCL
jgi:hypothetical protein